LNYKYTLKMKDKNVKQVLVGVGTSGRGRGMERIKESEYG
jgi:hypothetical protein